MPNNHLKSLQEYMPILILLLGAVTAEVGMETEIATVSILGFVCVFVGAIGFARMVWDRVKK
jgi:multisubunit Na+/H+ antiporter MnhG subunit